MRNFELKIREKEILALVREITKPGVLAALGQDWR
jgi:hypothetical protein